MSRYPSFSDPADLELSHRDADQIESLLVGHTVVKVDDEHLRLDDGTVLYLEGNEGCGGCSNGQYDLTALNGCENAITRVEIIDEDFGEGREGPKTRYEIFVIADHQKINLAAFEGEDGNGYYGTGFTIHVTYAGGGHWAQ